MDDVDPVGSLEGRGDLAADAERVAGDQALPALDAVPQRLAGEVLHGEVGDAALLVAIVVHLHDAGVRDQVGGAGLVEEAARQLGAGGVLGAQDLDRGVLGDVLADGLVDDAHSAFPELPHEAVLADALADHLERPEGADPRWPPPILPHRGGARSRPPRPPATRRLSDGRAASLRRPRRPAVPPRGYLQLIIRR
ncbi:MAG: hypothetical protein U1A78_19905 [Polyangia bacterium]